MLQIGDQCFEYLIFVSVPDWLPHMSCGSVLAPLTHSYFVVTYCCRLPTISLQAPKQPVTNLSVLNEIELSIPKDCGFFLFESSLFVSCSEYFPAVFLRELKIECMRSIRTEIAHWPFVSQWRLQR